MAEWKRAFLKDFGALIQIPGWMCIPSLIVIAIFDEWFALIPFAVLAVVSIGTGQLLYWINKKHEKTKPGSAYALVSLAWLIIPLLGTIPFIGVAHFINFSNAQVELFSNFYNSFFESMSGFTSTGLTMLEDSSQIPKCLQWWRSFSEWIGGLGIIFIAVAFLDTSHGSDELYQSEAMDWTIEDNSARKTIYKIWWIYLGFTVLSVLAFYTGGMPLWEAINHGLTGISTGGFTVTEDSFISYSPTIKWIAIVIMIMGALSFKIHYIMIFKTQFKKLIRQTQLHYFFAFFLFFFIILNIIEYDISYVDKVFQVASALGTCGFNSVDLDYWTTPVLFPLLLVMFLGGNTSSTTGGIKTKRIAWLIKAVRYKIEQFLLPETEKRRALFYFNRNLVVEGEGYKQILLAAILLFLWIFVLITGSFITSIYLHEQFDFSNILFDVNSALNNVGLSSGVTGSDMPDIIKILFSVIMWLGRLEIIGVIVMFSFFLKKKY